jgi:hypothetical protein
MYCSWLQGQTFSVENKNGAYSLTTSSSVEHQFAGILVQQIGGYTHSSERAVRFASKWLLTIRPENSLVARRLAKFQHIEENSVYLGVS